MLRLILTHAKKHPSLIPLFVFIVFVGVGSIVYDLRVAMFSPEVSWNKKDNPDTWNKNGPNYQYKFYNETIDYKNLNKEGPDF